MKTRIITALLILTVYAGAAVKDMVVSLWPEYDHPGVLVILSGNITDETNLPAELVFQVPDRVQQVLTLGAAEKGDSTIAFPTEGQSITIPFKHRHFQVEYYVHPFEDSHTREMEFNLQPGFDVLESLTFYLQEPLTAQQFNISYEADLVESDRHGLKYHRKDFGPVNADFRYTVNFSYHNHEELLSIEKLRQMMSGQSQTGAMPPQQSPDPSAGTVWIYIIIGVLVVAVLAVFNRKAIASYNGKEKVSAEKAFCTECGKAVSSDHLFCPWCGAKRN